jgi:hypothetical protein
MDAYPEIRSATEQAELEQLFSFRYRIYVEEMQRKQKYADHSSKQIRDPLDDFAINLVAWDVSTQAGAGYMAALKAAGVPDAAMTFLHEHVTVDVAHNNLMQEYLRRLVRTESDLSAVAYAIRVTGYLYGEMLAGGVRSVEHGIPLYPNFAELDRHAGPTQNTLKSSGPKSAATKVRRRRSPTGKPAS